MDGCVLCVRVMLLWWWGDGGDGVTVSLFKLQGGGDGESSPGHGLGASPVISPQVDFGAAAREQV